MPRPNRDRAVFAEEHLAERIARERQSRGWTTDGLAQRMTDAGCTMTGSAIYKIEKGEPRRRIVVDELVAFAQVFGVPVPELLMSPQFAAERDLVTKVRAWGEATDEASAANVKVAECAADLESYIDERPELREMTQDLATAWIASMVAPIGLDGLEQRLLDLLSESAAGWAEVTRIVSSIHVSARGAASRTVRSADGEHSEAT